MDPDEIDIDALLAAMPRVHVDRLSEQDMADAFAITADDSDLHEPTEPWAPTDYDNRS